MFKYLAYFSLFITFCHPRLFLVNCGQFSDGEQSFIQQNEDELDSGASLVKEFREINRKLIQRTHSCDPELNMNIIDKIDQDSKDKSNKYFRFVKSKKLILALRTLINKNTCNRIGYELAVENFFALDGKVFKKEKDVDYCLGRLDNIFVHYLERHANVCRDIYFHTFERKLESMDKGKLERVNYFAGNAINQLISKKKDENKLKSIGQRLMLLTSVYMNPKPMYIFQRLKALVKGHRDEKALTGSRDRKTNMMMVDRSKFERLFDEYLVQPCRYYEDQLGPDVFEPVSFEREFHKVDENNPDFYKAWGRYRFCLLFNREVDEKLDETISYAIKSSEV